LELALRSGLKVFTTVLEGRAVRLVGIPPPTDREAIFLAAQHYFAARGAAPTRKVAIQVSVCAPRPAR
jgi:hypothetical protein